jgi:hypothetical protein
MKKIVAFIIVSVLFSISSSAVAAEWRALMPGGLYVANTCRMELDDRNAIFSYSEKVGKTCHVVQRTTFDLDTGERYIGYATTFLRRGKLLYQPAVIDGDLFITHCCNRDIPADVPERLHDALMLYCEPAH